MALAAFGALTLLLCVTAANGQARSCKHPKLKVSKRVVKEGRSTRVSGTTCRGGGGVVKIRLKAGKRWRTIDRTHPRRNGRFAEQVRIIKTKGHRRGRLRAVYLRGRSPAVPLKILGKGGGCALDDPGSTLGITLSGCQVVASDTAAGSPLPFWGFLACQNSSRVQQVSGGGDSHATATGAPQGNSDYRRTTVVDGDDPYGWGERCELGENDHDGPTAFYHEGQRRATFVSMRLPSNFPLAADAWQTVLQMKEAQPYDNDLYCCPILFMEAFDNEWVIDSNNGSYWHFPAQSNVWTRFLFDVTYSADPKKGSLQVSADLNADGDFDDQDERMPRIHTNTLISETDGPHGTSDGLAPGDSIPSHLRAGIYHNSSISCPPPGGCSTEIDNLQVVAP